MRHGWVVCAGLWLIGCGGGGDDGNGGGVMVHAQFVKGATPDPVAPFAPLLAPAPQDGDWLLSPDKVTAHVTFINFQTGNANSGGGGGMVTGCDVTFDSSATAATKLLDCPIEVQPNTYTRLNLQVKLEFQVTISDPTNGFFTDASAPGKLSATMPAGGAQEVTLTPMFGASAEQVFLEPLVIEEGMTPPEISIVVDALHTVNATVTGGVPSITGGAPLVVFPSIGGAARAQFYTTSGTARSALFDPDVTAAPSDIRIYDAPNGGQPAFAFISYAGGRGVPPNCYNGVAGKSAYAADAAKFDPNQSGGRPGGYLGRDSTGTVCWALGGDGAFTTVAAYLTMKEVNTLGGMTSLTCENPTTVSHPTSGDTYASGCPATTASPRARYVRARRAVRRLLHHPRAHHGASLTTNVMVVLSSPALTNSSAVPTASAETSTNAPCVAEIETTPSGERLQLARTGIGASPGHAQISLELAQVDSPTTS